MALGKWSDDETPIQDEIIKTFHDTSHLVIYVATFFLPRDDGNHHRALVFPVKGPSICTINLQGIFYGLLHFSCFDNYWRLWQAYIKLEFYIVVSQYSLISNSYTEYTTW